MGLSSLKLDRMGRNDPQYRNRPEMMQHVRRYAAKKRAASSFFDAQVPLLPSAPKGSGARAGQSSQAPRPSIFTWGFDEITWFARQPENCRNKWLRCAWKWLKEHDPNGFLQMPGSRMLTSGAPAVGAGGVNRCRYVANTNGAACPHGSGKEEAIKLIWAEDVRK